MIEHMFESFRYCIESLDAAGMTDAERVDVIRELEKLKCAAEAAQAELAAALGEGRGAAAQVALARRESPHRGQQHLALARVLPELPHTRAAFRAGRITEWRATLIARETACLSLEDRRAVDRAIAGDAEAVESYSDRVVLGELRKLAARLDPASVAERRRRAESERCVTVRPAPDTMAYLTVLLPVAQAVACYAALTHEADTAVASGEPRSRGQLMADTLVARVTGAPLVDGRPVVPVTLGLVMTDAALLGGAPDTAHLPGHGPVPAELARSLVADHLDTGSRLWLRRLYASPDTGELVALDSHQRLFRGRLREFLDLRDQFCRTPWCNAPIRHRDHVVRAADAGTTTAAAGQGLCATCNYVKEAPGWRARPSPEARGHAVEITTPTGHTYTSHAPPLVALRAGAYRQVDDGVWTLVA
ncbi:hypothetical protein ACVW2K_003398 [Nocardioides sp. HB32]